MKGGDLDSDCTVWTVWTVLYFYFKNDFEAKKAMINCRVFKIVKLYINCGRRW